MLRGGALFDPPDAVVDAEVLVCGFGSTTTVLVVLVQALRAQRPALMRASRFKGASSKKVGPNVVFPPCEVGLEITFGPWAPWSTWG